MLEKGVSEKYKNFKPIGQKETEAVPSTLICYTEKSITKTIHFSLILIHNLPQQLWDSLTLPDSAFSSLVSGVQ